jgi:mono/diheme cytochrome c family protein
MTTRPSMVVVAMLLLLLVTACKTNQTSSSPSANNNRQAPQATPDQFAAARPIYEKECKSCHGDTGAGGPVKLEDGSKLKVPSLREARAVRHEDAEFMKQITKGGDGMPAFDQKLTTDQMNDLIKMIRKEFQAGATPPAK